MLLEKLTLAGRLLAGSGYGEVKGPGWLLRTNVESNTREAVEDALKSTAATFDAVFPGLPPAPEDSPATILIFRDEEALTQVAAFDNLVPRSGTIAGQYTSWDRLIYTSAARDVPKARTVGTVAHEITHHLVTWRLYGGTKSPPFWVNEGLASFVECLERGVGGGAIDLAAVEKDRMYRGPYSWRAPAAVYLDALARAAGSGGIPDVATLLDAREGDRIPLSVDLAYGTSWLLAHYLINAEGGRYRRPFQAWMTRPDGDGGGDSLAAALGRSLESIQADLQEYWKRLR